MDKSITFNLSENEFSKLETLAKTQQKSLSEFVRSMALLFTGPNEVVKDVDSSEIKKNFESDLQFMAEQLQKQQQFIDLLLRSIYSTQLRLEGQFKKYRKDAAKELEKDFRRISLIIDSTPSKKL